jgi:hypothetical protein
MLLCYKYIIKAKYYFSVCEFTSFTRLSQHVQHEWEDLKVTSDCSLRMKVNRKPSSRKSGDLFFCYSVNSLCLSYVSLTWPNLTFLSETIKKYQNACKSSLLWWPMLLLPVFRRLRKENLDFQGRLGHTARHSLGKKKTKKQ